MLPDLMTNVTIWYHTAKTCSELAEDGLLGAGIFKANTQQAFVGKVMAIANIALHLVMLREALIVNYKGVSDNNNWLGKSIGKKTEHVLVAVLLGMANSNGVGWVVRPITAGTAVRKQLETVLQSFCAVLTQLVAFVVHVRNAPAAGHKQHGAKPGELKKELRTHLMQQKLQRQVNTIALDPSVWSVWARHNTALNNLGLYLAAWARHSSCAQTSLSG
ncbi:hypothetical protein GGF43_006181 [Coemansia sp. RSA 2618]|nr:hypothetical protein GGF43_006181 [Coemansia sp. RSA 2618]